MDIEEFYKSYSDKGYLFSDELLTRYTLSLATKPFVILSGISGTGKTKIAQLFEVPVVNISAEELVKKDIVNNGYILLNVTEGLATGDGRSNIIFGQLPAVLEQDEIAELDNLIEIKRAQNDGGNICEPIPLTIDTPEGEQLEVSLYLQRASSPLARLRAKSKRGGEKEYDYRSYFNNNYDIGDVLKLEKVSKHHLRIAAVNDEDIIYENKEQKKEQIKYIDNKCFISVKSNWTDATELFGYFNPLTERYSMTKLLRFVLLANENPEIPFFVILDEMNLAKVEHYFSDFLSCLESRIIDNDGSVKQEGIHLHSGNEFILTDDDEYDEIESKLNIPLNLYVTGTVNVDDTTYMFSPKVLDRANVIELNDVYLDEQPNDTGFKMSSFPDFCSYEKSNMKMYDSLSDGVKNIIKDILSVLKKYNLHFGYRTISEISHFIQNAKACVNTDNDTELAALDIQVLQKILPKLHGNYAKLSEPIKELIYLLSNGKGGIENFDYNEIEAINVDTADFKRSLTKLIKMYSTLSTQGFASYIE